MWRDVLLHGLLDRLEYRRRRLFVIVFLRSDVCVLPRLTAVLLNCSCFDEAVLSQLPLQNVIDLLEVETILPASSDSDECYHRAYEDFEQLIRENS